MLAGWADPLAFLDLEGADAVVARQIVQVASDMQHERRRQEIVAVGIAVGNAVGRLLAKVFRG